MRGTRIPETNGNERDQDSDDNEDNEKLEERERQVVGRLCQTPNLEKAFHDIPQQGRAASPQTSWLNWIV